MGNPVPGCAFSVPAWNFTFEKKVSRSRLRFYGAGGWGERGAGKGSLMNRKAVIILVIIVAVILLVLLVIYAANLTSGYKPY